MSPQRAFLWSDECSPEERLEHVRRALREQKGNVTRAAAQLGTKRTALQWFISQHVAALDLEHTARCPKCGHLIRLDRQAFKRPPGGRARKPRAA